MSGTPSLTWVWEADENRFVRAEPSGPLLLADSWYVEDGRSLSLAPHQERFSRGLRQLDVPPTGSDGAWEQLADLVPSLGRWFPRIELLAGETDGQAQSTEGPGGGDSGPSAAPARLLTFRVRPAPERTRRLSLWIPPFSDPRRRPTIKGPDIALLGGLMKTAIDEHDCGDLVLFDADGYVLETGTSSLLFWDEDILCVPDARLNVLAGTTSARILREAERRGIRVDHRFITVDELAGYEIWSVNALHGIRRIIGLSNGCGGELARPNHCFEHWRRWLESERRPRVDHPRPSAEAADER